MTCIVSHAQFKSLPRLFPNQTRTRNFRGRISRPEPVPNALGFEISRKNPDPVGKTTVQSRTIREGGCFLLILTTMLQMNRNSKKICVIPLHYNNTSLTYQLRLGIFLCVKIQKTRCKKIRESCFLLRLSIISW